MRFGTAKQFSTQQEVYLFNWFHEGLNFFIFLLHHIFQVCRKDLIEIFLCLFLPLIINDFLQSIKVIVLKHIRFEVVKLLCAERTPMMPSNCLLNAAFTVNVAAPGHIAIADRAEANLALELCFQFFNWYLEGSREFLLVHEDYYDIPTRLENLIILMKSYGQYTIVGQKVGSGAFGEIYMGVNKRNEKVGLKIQKNTGKNPQLFYEYKILQILDSDGRAHDRGLLKVYDYFTEGDDNVMVMKILGDSLESLFKKSNRSFPPKTTLMIGLQILDRIQYIHSKGFIHRDIKPDNFLVGKDNDNSTVFMIDFGLAKKYRNKDGEHIPYKDNKNLTGTARYASVNTHLGVEQGRRDDIEGMVYMLIYFFHGQLPWQNMDAKNKKQKYEKILEKKISTSPQQLCHGIPTQIMTILKYIRNVFFDEKPDYGYIRSELQAAMNEYQLVNDKVFAWNI